MENTTSRRGLKQYSSNPFLGDASSNTKQGIKRISDRTGQKMMVVSEHGEIMAPAGFWQIEEVDRSQFVKLYVNGVKAFKELTGAGTKVFELLYLQIQNGIGKDTVYLSMADVNQSLSPMSKATFMKGMRELLEKGFIAETVRTNQYFINPDYLFNGDRLALVKEFRVKGASRIPQDVADRDRLEQLGQQRLVD